MLEKDIKDQLAKDPHWKDAKGNTLLHFAAKLGDVATVKTCLEAGTTPHAYNNDNTNARDLARIWGHEAVAACIDAEMKRVPPKAIVYASLQEIRNAGALHRLVAQGQFDQVAALAVKEGKGFTVQELLSVDKEGDSLLFKICQQGQLPALLKPELWVRNVSALETVWGHIPQMFRKGLDFQVLADDIRRKSPPVPTTVRFKQKPNP